MDIFDKVMDQMDTCGKQTNRPADKNRPSSSVAPGYPRTERNVPKAPGSSATHGSTGNSVWDRRDAPRTPSSRPSASGSNPTQPSNSSFPSSFGRIPKRESTTDNAPLAKRRPTEGNFLLKFLEIDELFENSGGSSESFKPYTTVPVQLNSFKMDVSKMDPKIHRIMFKTFLVFSDGKEFELSDGVAAYRGE